MVSNSQQSLNISSKELLFVLLRQRTTPQRSWAALASEFGGWGGHCEGLEFRRFFAYFLAAKKVGPAEGDEWFETG